MKQTAAALFAGQGAQAVGMGKDLAEAHSECKALFDRADALLGHSLSSVVFEGPIERLTRTDVCQPAIFVASAAAWTAFRKLAPGAGFAAMAGLSLGEWTALWAAGAVSFDDAVRVLEARGRFMQEACETNPSGMVSILKLDPAACEAIAAETGCAVTNYNAAAQTVLGGTREQVEAAAAAATARGGRAVVLKTAGAYHSPFMASAAERLAPVLAGVEIREPSVPVLSNYTGRAHGSPDEIRAAMLAQIAHPVRWTDDTAAMSALGVGTFVEFGPGAVLTGMLRRALPDARLFNVSSADSAGAAAAAFQG
jgi:[acyl-carrier-protein] S-malonyltransferase